MAPRLHLGQILTVILLGVLAGHRSVGAVVDESKVKEPPVTCNSSAWDNINVRVPSVPEPMGGERCTTTVPMTNSSFVIVEEVVWRCEKRYCCGQNCHCSNMTLTEEPCMVQPPQLMPVELVCPVQHKLAPRFFRYICCEGYEEIDKICVKKINCDNNGGGCDHDCVKNNDVHVCTCRDGYQLYNRTQCKEAPTTQPTTVSTTMKPTTVTTISTTTTTTTSPTTTTSSTTKASTTTASTTPTTASPISTEAMTEKASRPPPKTTTTTPDLSTAVPADTKTKTSSTATTAMTSENASTPNARPAIPVDTDTEISTISSTTTTTKTATSPTETSTTDIPRGPNNVDSVKKKNQHGPALWILIIFPLVGGLLIILCFSCFFWRKRKPLYVKQDDEMPTETYDNFTYGKSGATGADVILPDHMIKKKQRPPILRMGPVVDVGDHPKSVKIIENDLYTDKSVKGREPKVVFGNYVSENLTLDDDGYMVPVSVYASGLPPPSEEDPYEPVGPGLAGPLPIKEPLQGYRTAEIENDLNENMESIYSEIP